MSVNYWFDAARTILEGVMSATSWPMFIGTFGIFLLTVLLVMMLTEQRHL